MGKGKRIKDKKELNEQQEKNAPEIQIIVQEELQYILEHLEEFEGLSEGQIQSNLLVKVRKRCMDELGMEIGH